MNTPSIYTPSELQNWPCGEEYEPGRYRPSRPVGWHLSGLHPRRWKIAWRVLIGRYDALDWGSVESGTPTAEELRKMVR